MNTIKIRFGDDVTPDLALKMVQAVIKEGRISSSKYGPCYCRVVKHHYLDLVAYADRTKTMDTFQVWHGPTTDRGDEG